MSWLWRRGDSDLGEPVVGADEWESESGWDTSPSSGARAVLTAGVRAVVWSVWLAGPLLGLAALSSTPTQASPAAVEAVQEDAGGQDVGPAGFAELFAAAYVEASVDDVVGARLERRSPQGDATPSQIAPCGGPHALYRVVRRSWFTASTPRRKSNDAPTPPGQRGR